MSAPRIDSTRNLVDQMILLLAEFRAEVHDIHDLSSNRGRAAEEAKVRGGDPDYCLDNHGDPEARRLYVTAVGSILRALGPVEISIKAIRSHLTAGRPSSGIFDKAKSAPKHEVAAAIARAEHNLGRSSRWDREHPHAIGPQPKVGYIEPTVELANLRNALTKMCSGVKPDRSRLTPAEQEAWRRATASQAVSTVAS